MQQAKAKFDDAELTEEPDKPIDERKVNGDASETGILKFAEKQESVAAYRMANPQVSTIPFNSASKMMLTINKDSTAPSGSVLRICFKGKRRAKKNQKKMILGTTVAIAAKI